MTSERATAAASILLWSICEIARSSSSDGESPGGYTVSSSTTTCSGSIHATIAPNAVTCVNRTVVMTRRPDDP